MRAALIFSFWPPHTSRHFLPAAFRVSADGKKRQRAFSRISAAPTAQSKKFPRPRIEKLQPPAERVVCPSSIEAYCLGLLSKEDVEKISITLSASRIPFPGIRSDFLRPLHIINILPFLCGAASMPFAKALFHTPSQAGGFITPIRLAENRHKARPAHRNALYARCFFVYATAQCAPSARRRSSARRYNRPSEARRSARAPCRP